MKADIRRTALASHKLTKRLDIESSRAYHYRGGGAVHTKLTWYRNAKTPGMQKDKICMKQPGMRAEADAERWAHGGKRRPRVARGRVGWARPGWAWGH